jgi:hypothetical protein
MKPVVAQHHFRFQKTMEKNTKHVRRKKKVSKDTTTFPGKQEAKKVP